MELSNFFKSVIDSDPAPVVICNTEHEIIYMNPMAVERYAKRGGAKLIGRSLLDCHNAESNQKIKLFWNGSQNPPTITEYSLFIIPRKTRTFI